MHNPGLAYDLVVRWANLAEQRPVDKWLAVELHGEIADETKRQLVPAHSMWSDMIHVDEAFPLVDVYRSGGNFDGATGHVCRLLYLSRLV